MSYNYHEKFDDLIEVIARGPGEAPYAAVLNRIADALDELARPARLAREGWPPPARRGMTSEQGKV